MGVAELGLEPAVAQPGCVPWHRSCPQHPPEEAGGAGELHQVLSLSQRR